MNQLIKNRHKFFSEFEENHFDQPEDEYLADEKLCFENNPPTAIDEAA